ncbi:MAG TPA: OmpA family protein [Candidatus Edwardsbacteria bacterium]|nr:OmpA family protein [Candidatus Edwardsbacteria bacterium]
MRKICLLALLMTLCTAAVWASGPYLPPAYDGGCGLFKVSSARTLGWGKLAIGFLQGDYTSLENAKGTSTKPNPFFQGDSSGLPDKMHKGSLRFVMTYALDYVEFSTAARMYAVYDQHSDGTNRYDMQNYDLAYLWLRDIAIKVKGSYPSRKYGVFSYAVGLEPFINLGMSSNASYLYTSNPNPPKPADSVLMTHGFLELVPYNSDYGAKFLGTIQVGPVQLHGNLGYLKAGKSRDAFMIDYSRRMLAVDTLSSLMPTDSTARRHLIDSVLVNQTTHDSSYFFHPAVRGAVPRSDQILWGAGLEVAAGPYVTFLVEAHGERNKDWGSYLWDNPAVITPGIRFNTPGGLTMDGGCEFKLGANAASPDWNAVFGMSVTASTLPKRVKVITEGTLAGTVIDKETGKPLPGVAITMVDTAGKAMTTVKVEGKTRPGTAVSDSAGAFSLVLPARRVKTLRAELEGYVAKEMKAPIQPAQVNSIVVELAKIEIPRGFIAGKVADAKTGLPVRALFNFAGTEFQPIPNDTGNGTYNIGMAPGSYKVIVTAEGYNPDSCDFAVENKKTTPHDFALRMIPRKGERFIIRGVTFVPNKDAIVDGSVLYSDKELINLPALVVKLIDSRNPVSAFLRQQFSPRTNRLLDNYSPGRGNLLLGKSLARDLNKLIKAGTLLYSADKFKDVKLSERTSKLLAQNPSADQLVRLNRMLIDDSYPTEIVRAKPGTYEVLAEAGKILTDNPTIKVEIGGHTSSIGSLKKNLILSQARAEAVKKVLVGYGIDPLRMSTRGYGPSVPISDNKTRQGRAENQRIEFTVTE